MARGKNERAGKLMLCIRAAVTQLMSFRDRRSRNPESMNTDQRKNARLTVHYRRAAVLLDSGFGAARRPGMTFGVGLVVLLVLVAQAPAAAAAEEEGGLKLPRFVS